MFFSLAFAFQHAVSIFDTPKYPVGFDHFKSSNPDAPKGGTLKMPAINNFDSFNQFIVLGTSATGLFPFTIATLLKDSEEEPGTSYGYLASKLTIEDNVITFYLNPSAKFDNGDPITAEDVIFAYEMLIKHGMPIYRTYYKMVQKAEQIDQQTVRFTIDPKNKSRELPLILGQLPAISKKFYKTHDFTKPSLDIPPSSGPYTIASFSGSKKITYQRNPDWWGKDIGINKGAYNFDKIVFTYFADSNAQFEAFKVGRDINVRVEPIISQWVREYDFPAVKAGKVKKMSLSNKMPAFTSGLFLNTRRPLFKSLKTRKALNFLMDFNWINKTQFENMYQRNHSYFAKSDFDSSQNLKITSPYSAEDLELGDYKTHGELRDGIAKAQALLKEDGWNLKNGILSKGDMVFSFEILLRSQNYAKIFSNFIDTLQRCGIKAELRVVDSANYNRLKENLEYDVIFETIAQTATLGNEQRNYWGSKGANAPGTMNYSGINDPEVDTKIEKLIESQTYSELIANTQELDLKLRAGYYAILGWHDNKINIAYWQGFRFPEFNPPYSLVNITSWWYDGDDNGSRNIGLFTRFKNWILSFV